MAFVAMCVFFMGRTGVLHTAEAWALLAITVIYTIGVVVLGRRATPTELVSKLPQSNSATKEVLLLLISLGIIVVGADLLVQGSVAIATMLGVSDMIIGLTIVAIGTSAPELVTTLVSTFRGERDIAIGNLIGSSIYNIAFVLAATTIIVPGHIPVPEVIRTDLALIAIVTLACIPVFFSSRTMNRIEGALFVLAYCAYLIWLLTTQA